MNVYRRLLNGLRASSRDQHDARSYRYLKRWGAIQLERGRKEMRELQLGADDTPYQLHKLEGETDLLINLGLVMTELEKQR